MNDASDIEIIHRVCSMIDGTMMSGSYIDEGLFPDDIDYLEAYCLIRLINKDMPKTLFEVPR